MTLPSAPVFADASMDSDFRRDGFVVVPLLNADEVQSLKQSFAAIVPEVPTDFFAGLGLDDSPMRRALSGTVHAMLAPRIADLMPGYAACVNDFLVKRGASTQPLPMHQDYSFVDPSLHACIHLWCPLLDVDESNGCITVVKGSHDLVTHISAIPTNPSPFDQYRPVLESECMTPIPLTAGVALLFNQRLLHASTPNRSAGLRIAVGGAYLPATVKQRLYVQSDTAVSTFEIVEIRDQFAISLAGGKPLPKPYGDGVTYAGSLEYTAPVVTQQQIDALRVRPAVEAVAPIPSQRAAAPAARKPSFFARLFGRG